MIKNHSSNDCKFTGGQDEASLEKGKAENTGRGLKLVNRAGASILSFKLQCPHQHNQLDANQYQPE